MSSRSLFRWLRSAVGLLFALLSCGAALAQAPSPPDLIWGANGHPTNAYGAVTLDEQMATLRRLGMTHYRVGAEPLNKVEEMLRAAARHGVTLLPVLTPDTKFDAHSAEMIYANSYRIAYQTAARFKGRVAVWELGNELEGYALIKPCETRDDGSKYPCEWGVASGVGPTDYYGPRWRKVSAALKGMSDGVHDADPAAKRAAGSAGWGHTGMFDRMKADGIGWEISVWHEYGGDPEWAMKLLAAHGKPIWVTEFGGNSEKGEADQAEHIRKLMRKLRQLRGYGIAAAFVYELLDEPYWTDFEGKMGLVGMVRNKAGRWVLGADKLAAEVVRAEIAAGG